MRAIRTTNYAALGLFLSAVIGSLLSPALAQVNGARNQESGEVALFGKLDADIGECSVVSKGEAAVLERDFISVSVPSIGDSLVIDLAELVVTISSEIDAADPLILAAAAATVDPLNRPTTWQQDWNESSGGFDPEFLAMIPIGASRTSVEIRIDVTEIVKRWCGGEAPNYGFVLKSMSESKSTFHWIRDGHYDGLGAKLDIWYSRI